MSVRRTPRAFNKLGGYEAEVMMSVESACLHFNKGRS